MGVFVRAVKLDSPGTVKNDGCAGIFFNKSGHISVIYELDQIKKLCFINSVMTNNPRNHKTHPLVEKKTNICFTKMVILFKKVQYLGYFLSYKRIQKNSMTLSHIS
jgi:hypothetical protein